MEKKKKAILELMNSVSVSCGVAAHLVLGLITIFIWYTCAGAYAESGGKEDPWKGWVVVGLGVLWEK